MRRHCIRTSQGFVGLLLSDHKWFKTTKERLDTYYKSLTPVDHRGLTVLEGYFVYDWNLQHWHVDDEVFPEVSEIIEIEDSNDIYVTTYSSEAALRYKLMIG